MSRSRLVLSSIVVVSALGMGLIFAQTGDPNTEILKKLDSLEQKIASLEKSLNTRLVSMEKAIAAGGAAKGSPAAPDAETKAQAAFAKVNSLVSEGKFPEAKVEMDAFMNKYPATNAAKQASRLNQELAVIGKDAPADWGIEDRKSVV